MTSLPKNNCSAPRLLRGKRSWLGPVSTRMAHPPVTQPGPADGRPLGKPTQKSHRSPKPSQGRRILEDLGLTPAFTNRARRGAIVLQKHPSGKFHLIIMGNCGIRLKSRTQNNSGLLGVCCFAGDCRSHTVGLSGLGSGVTLFSKQPQLLPSQVGWSLSMSLEPLGALDFVVQAHALPLPSDFQRQGPHVRLMG